MEPKRVMIADNSPEICSEFAEALKWHEGFVLVGDANDGEQAIQMVNKLQPDILVLDLMLDKQDGIAVLKNIGGMEKRPVVISVSGFITDYVASAAAALGSRYLLLKPYSVEMLIERMEEIANEKPRRQNMDAEETLTNHDLRIVKAIHALGIPANLKGYFYLIEAVKIAVDDKMAVFNMTQGIYAPVAEQFHTTVQRVSRAISRAIEIGWDRGDISVLHDYFGDTISNYRGKPTNSECIAIVAERIRLGMIK